MLKNFYWTLVVMIALAGCASAGAEKDIPPPAGAKVAPLPNPKPGSQWMIRLADGSTRLFEVKDGKFFSPERGIIYTNEWNLIEGPGPKTGAWVVYSPHVRTYSFPLWESKKWGGWSTWTSGTYRGSFSTAAEAKKWETIIVPAGTFEAIRVENFSDGAPFSTCWYAVEAEFPIKCTFSEYKWRDYELVEYKLTK